MRDLTQNEFSHISGGGGVFELPESKTLEFIAGAILSCVFTAPAALFIFGLEAYSGAGPRRGLMLAASIMGITGAAVGMSYALSTDTKSWAI